MASVGHDVGCVRGGNHLGVARRVDRSPNRLNGTRKLNAIEKLCVRNHGFANERQSLDGQSLNQSGVFFSATGLHSVIHPADAIKNDEAINAFAKLPSGFGVKAGESCARVVCEANLDHSVGECAEIDACVRPAGGNKWLSRCVRATHSCHLFCLGLEPLRPDGAKLPLPRLRDGFSPLGYGARRDAEQIGEVFCSPTS